MADYRVVDTEQLENDLTVVADAIREKGGTSEQLEFPNGMADAVRAIESGDDNYYDAFWDTYQQNGLRTNYQYAFTSGWSLELFKPKHPFKIKKSLPL